jgi:hypothetical protein
MNRLLLFAAMFALTSVSGTAFGAEAPPPQTYAVFGLRAPGAPPVTELVSQFRKALSQVATAGASAAVQSEAETRAGLGFAKISTGTLLTRLGDAEGDYQQFALDSARAKFEAGLQELASAGGEDGVWDAAVTGHVLLGMIHLAGKTRDAQAKAQAEFEAIVRVYPGFQAMGHSGDPVVLALFEKARAKLNRATSGELLVSCSSACPTGYIWVDAAPRGKVNGEPVRLPPGTYRVRVTDRQDAPRLFSFTHEVEIREGAQTRLLVDLESEGALDLGGGPAFLIPAEGDLRLRTLRLAAQRLHRGKVAALWLDAQDIHLAILDSATGKIERHAAIASRADGKLEAPCLDLARFAVGGEPPPLSVAPLAPLLDARRPIEPAQGARAMSIAKWGALGTTAALGVAGLALAISANADRSSLTDQQNRWGGTIPPQNLPKFSSDTEAVLTKERWRNGLLIGGAACAVGAAALFAVDYFGQHRAAAPENRQAHRRTSESGGGPARASGPAIEIRPDGLALLF